MVSLMMLVECIGTFNIDLGIQHRGDKECYMSNSQMEWNSQIARLCNNIGDYILFGMYGTQFITLLLNKVS